MLGHRPFRKKLNYGIALITEVTAPLLRSYARARTQQSVSSPQTWKKALVLSDNHIGDLLYRSCCLDALCDGLPDCKFYYLTAADGAEVLKGNPYLEAILPWARSDQVTDLLPEHLTALHDIKFDAALCTNCIRYWPELLLAIRLGIPNRVAYTHKGLSGWVTHAMPLHYPKPYPAYFREYVGALTGRRITKELRPELFVSADAQAKARSTWLELKLDNSRPVIAFFMTSRQDTAMWPVASHLALFEMLEARLRAQVVLVGGSNDRQFLTAVAKRAAIHPPVIAGDLDVQAAAGFVERCALVITKDSGPRHIANAVGTRALFFRDTSQSQDQLGEYCSTECDLVPAAEFLSKRQQTALLAEIAPETVLRRIETVLSAWTPCEGP